MPEACGWAKAESLETALMQWSLSSGLDRKYAGGSKMCGLMFAKCMLAVGGYMPQGPHDPLHSC